jgi:hypothetical protein
MMTCVFAGFCRTSWQRDLSVSYDRVGDVLVAQGNLPEALKSFRDGLAIAERLAQADRGNAGWQFDFVVSHWKLAANGDDAPRRWAFIVATLRKLKAEFRLTPVQESGCSSPKDSSKKGRQLVHTGFGRGLYLHLCSLHTRHARRFGPRWLMRRSLKRRLDGTRLR